MIGEKPREEAGVTPEGEDPKISFESSEPKFLDPEGEVGPEGKIEALYRKRMARLDEAIKEIFDRPEAYGVHGDGGKGNYGGTLTEAKRLETEKQRGLHKDKEPTRDQTLALRLSAKSEEIEKERRDALAALTGGKSKDVEKMIENI